LATTSTRYFTGFSDTTGYFSSGALGVNKNAIPPARNPARQPFSFNMLAASCMTDIEATPPFSALSDYMAPHHHKP
jgi:hypothetical protein